MYALVDDLIKGLLDEQQVDQVWAEMLDNPELFAYYRTQIGLVVELNDENYQKNIKVKPIFNWWLAAAAAVILLISVSGYFVQQSNQKEKAIEAFIAFNAYDLQNLDAYRSTNTYDSTFKTKVTQATTALLLGDVQEALTLYTKLINTTTHSNEMNALLHFNSALVYYADKNYTLSFNDLEKATTFDTEAKLRAKINCQKLKILVAEKKFNEAKSFANQCLEEDIALTKSQRDFIKKIAE